jgi:uncharacterized repeat protein (TIGR03803 family)
VCSRFIIVVGLLLLSVAASAQTYKVIASITDSTTTLSSLVQGRDGNLYGTTNDGGSSGYGSVYKVTTAGVLTVLYNFCSQPNCQDGYYPFAPLVVGQDGNFYGTTQNGGPDGIGTVFKITPSGVFTVLHGFHGFDGSSPNAGLVLASDGNFYGAAAEGGELGGGGGGTVFRLTPAGDFTVLHAFNRHDGPGSIAFSSLIQADDGNLYGTTLGGGIQTFWCDYIGYGGCGTIFKITTTGTFTNLHQFDLSDGSTPWDPVLEASDGNLYGTTWAGGYGYGTVFKSTKSGQVTVLHRFHYGQGNNYAGLIQGTDGNLYGEDFEDFAIYQLTLNGKYTTEFVGVDGNTPLMQGTDGKFYGTSGSGGYYTGGTVWSFDMGLGPFVSFVLPAGKAGATAQILGQGFKGTSAVTFNGVPASFTIESDTYLTAVVPQGATSGKVVVTTPGGTLTSNVAFRITQ